MKKIYIFVGSPNSGRAFFTKYIANILSNDGKKVGMLDANKKKGLFNSVCTDRKDREINSIKNLKKLENTSIAIGENIDIYTASPFEKMEDHVYEKAFSNLIKMDYDVILINADMDKALRFLDIYRDSKIYLIQSQARESALEIRKSFIEELELRIKEDKTIDINLILNKTIPSKMTIDEVLEILNLNKFNTHEIEVPFNLDNYIKDSSNKAIGSIDTKGLSMDIRKVLFKIANEIIPLDSKLKKIA